MAATNGTSSGFGSNSTLAFRHPRTSISFQAISAGSNNDWRNDSVTKQLTQQVAFCLYFRDGPEELQPDDVRWPFLNSNIHKHEDISKLLSEYEPGAKINPEQLRVLLKALKPLVKKGEASLALYKFIKKFLFLRREWLETAGELYALLAYLAVCKKWGLPGAGPAYPPRSQEIVEGIVQEIRQRFETKCTTLRTFKLSDSFYTNMRALFAYYDKMKEEDARRAKRNRDAVKLAEEEDRKRLALKRQNQMVAGRQLGSIGADEMGDGLQQHVLDMMSHVMKIELGVKGSTGGK